MFGFVAISPFLINKKDNLKASLQVMGYGYSVKGVKRFQKENGIPSTGYIDSCTAMIIERKMGRE